MPSWPMQLSHVLRGAVEEVFRVACRLAGRGPGGCWRRAVGAGDSVLLVRRDPPPEAEAEESESLNVMASPGRRCSLRRNGGCDGGRRGGGPVC